MTALPNESWLNNLRPQPERLTAEAYESLSEEICQAIEVVDGYIVYCESPTREHQTAGRRLAHLIERQAKEVTGLGCLAVNTDVDLRIRDVPLLNRRPDVILHRCLDSGLKLRPEHALLIVEIVSPGSETQDTEDKFTEYAKAGIPHYWIVRLDAQGVSIIERYQLDTAVKVYRHVGTFMKDAGGEVPAVSNPIALKIDWAELEY